MRRLWNEIKDHQLASAIFLIYWLIVFGLDVFRWHKPANRPDDMLRSVLYLHFLLPVIAGAMVSWWRRYRSGGITGAMLAGAAVLVLDAAAVLTWHFFDFRYWESSSNESVFELPVLLIALALFGALLGLIGATGATGLGDLLDRWRRPSAPLVSLFPDQPAEGDGGAAVKTRLGGAEKVTPRRLQRVAAGLAWGAAVAVLVGVIPPLTADGIARTAPRAIPAFAVNAILNVLIGFVLLVPVSRRSAGAGNVLVVMAGFVALLLGCALLDAASALVAHGPSRLVAALACLAGATGDLGAGVLALVAAFRRHGRNHAGPLPVH
jgi:hypothetical protein